jgi:ABC-type nickel/cobalt efflux system permease component RcnA
MKKPERVIRIFLTVLFACALCYGGARAHQQDMNNADHVLALRLTEESLDLTVHLQYKEFPSLAERRDMDSNGDGWIDEPEAAYYAQSEAKQLLESVELSINGQPLAMWLLEEPELEFYGSARVVPLHQDFSAKFSTTFKIPDPEEGFLLRVADRHEWPFPGKIFFALSAQRSLAVDSTSLDNAGRALSAGQLRNVWFTCRRRSESEIKEALEQGEDLWRMVTHARADNEPGITIASPDTAEKLAEIRVETDKEVHEEDEHERLSNLVLSYLKGEQDKKLPLWLLLAAAFIYGCIHALAPGHAKTITAAYLVGSRGTYGHALLLALTVTLTHTGSILALAVATKLLYGGELDTTGQAVLSGISGLIVVVFGIRRLMGRKEIQHSHGGQVHSHEHGHDHGGHEHTHEVRETQKESTVKKPRLELFWLGLAGGLMPCPGALWVYLLALGFGRPGLGILLLLALSLGLALVLVAVGVVSLALRNLVRAEQGRESVTGARRVSHWPLRWLRALGKPLSRLLPGFTGTLLILLGSFLLWKSVADLGWMG